MGSYRKRKTHWKGNWANESEGDLRKAETAGFGGSSATRLFAISIRLRVLQLLVVEEDIFLEAGKYEARLPRSCFLWM